MDELTRRGARLAQSQLHEDKAAKDYRRAAAAVDAARALATRAALEAWEASEEGSRLVAERDAALERLGAAQDATDAAADPN